MRKLIAFFVLILAFASFAPRPQAKPAPSNEAEIRSLLDHWAKAFQSRDLEGIMSTYEPGHALIAYDIVPPLRYAGFDAYKKDYREFLDQFQGPVAVQFDDLTIIASDSVAFSHGLERMSGTLKSGEKFDSWVRFTEGYRKTNGKWYAIHDHISVPVDMASGKALFDLKP